MKIIEMQGLDHVVIPIGQYQQLIAKQFASINGIPVNIQIPFKDNNCSNWNEDHNEYNHTGIIINDKKITTKELKLLAKLLRKGFGEGIISVRSRLQGSEIKIEEVENIIDRIDSFKVQRKHSDKLEFPRELQISI